MSLLRGSVHRGRDGGVTAGLNPWDENWAKGRTPDAGGAVVGIGLDSRL